MQLFDLEFYDESDFDDYTESMAYRRLIAGNQFKHRIARLRAFFALGLGREIPVSQTEFSFWCGMSRETITAVESGRTPISTRLAERIYNLTGAELSWLTGRVGEETYGYPSLHAWFPKTMPLSADDISRVHSYRFSSYYKTINQILGQLSRRWYARTSDVRLPAAVIKNAFDRFTFPDNWGCYPPLWKAFAFASGPDEIHRAIEDKMLSDAPADSPLGEILKSKPQIPDVIEDRQFFTEVCHNMILTLSMVERGLIPAPANAAGSSEQACESVPDVSHQGE